MRDNILDWIEDHRKLVISLIIIIVTLLFFALAILIWVFCAKRYESSGS